MSSFSSAEHNKYKREGGHKSSTAGGKDGDIDKERGRDKASSSRSSSSKRGPGRPPKNPRPDEGKFSSAKTKLAVKKVKLKCGRKPGPKKIKIIQKHKSTPKSSQVSSKQEDAVPKTDPKEKESCKDKESSSSANNSSSKSPKQETKHADTLSTSKPLNRNKLGDNGIYDFPSDDCDSTKGLVSNNLPERSAVVKNYWVPPDFMKPVVDSIVITDVASSDLMVTVRECSYNKGFLT